MSHVDDEIASQPVCWAQAVELAARSADALPARGERVAVLGYGTSARSRADEAVPLPFADERSAVQTRFATSVLVLLRAHLGEDLSTATADAAEALHGPLPLDPGAIEQVTFLGRGWTIGLAYEAALAVAVAMVRGLDPDRLRLAVLS